MLLSLLTAAFVLLIEFARVTLERAPNWLCGVLACFFLSLNAIPVGLSGLVPFNPCLGDRYPYTPNQLAFLQSCSRLGSLYINDATVAQDTMQFEAKVVGIVSFLGNSVVKDIDFPLLTLDSGSMISISGNENLETISFTGPGGFPIFTSPSLDISDNPALILVNLTAFERNSEVSQISNNTNLMEIDLSKMTGMNENFTIADNPSLEFLNFQSLQLIHVTSNLVIIENENLASVTFSALGTLGGSLTLSDTNNLVEVNLSNLGSILEAGYLSLFENQLLENIDFQSLSSICEYCRLSISGNPNLQSLSFPSLASRLLFCC